MTGSGTLPNPTVDRTRCAHPTRVRENHWGWASTETVWPDPGWLIQVE
jgi:hypothetical protein